MSISYGLLKKLKPSYFSEAKQVIIQIPVHVAERHKAKGVTPIFTIDIDEETACKDTIFQKIDEVITAWIQRVPGLYFNDFNFRVEGCFSDRGYV